MTMQPADLKALRDALGWSQQELADAIGMSRKAINEMESGKAKLEQRTALAAIFRAHRAIERIDRGMRHIEEDDAGALTKDVTDAYRATKVEELRALLSRLIMQMEEP